MNELEKFASDACTVIEACQDVIKQLADENKKLRLEKQASAEKVENTVKVEAVEAVEPAAIELDEASLNKAASAVYELHGSPVNCTAADIADYWKANPSSMLSTISKLASERIEAAVEGRDMGKIINKKASADSVKIDLTKADDAFWQNI